MDRKTVKAQLERLEKKRAKLRAYLAKTCRHPNQKSHRTNGHWDWFGEYETYCTDCLKVLSTRSE